MTYLSHAIYRGHTLPPTRTRGTIVGILKRSEINAPPIPDGHQRIDYRLCVDDQNTWRCVDVPDAIAADARGDYMHELIADIVDCVHNHRYDVDDCSCEPYRVEVHCDGLERCNQCDAPATHERNLMGRPTQYACDECAVQYGTWTALSIEDDEPDHGVTKGAPIELSNHRMLAPCPTIVTRIMRASNEALAREALISFFVARDGSCEPGHGRTENTWRVYPGQRGWDWGVRVDGRAFRIYGEN